MKARLATVLSLTGVLVAGSAAALVNTQVLNSSTAGNTVQLADQANPSSPSSNSLPAATVPIVTAGGSTTTAPADAHQAVYQIDQAGIVTLSKAGDVLTIVSIEPSSGWLVTEADQDDPYNIEVTFQSGFTEIEFHANLLFGVVGTSVEARTLPGNPVPVSSANTVGPNSSTPSAGTIDDDDTVGTDGTDHQDEDDTDDEIDDKDEDD